MLLVKENKCNYFLYTDNKGYGTALIVGSDGRPVRLARSLLISGQYLGWPRNIFGGTKFKPFKNPQKILSGSNAIIKKMAIDIDPATGFFRKNSRGGVKMVKVEGTCDVKIVSTYKYKQITKQFKRTDKDE